MAEFKLSGEMREHLPADFLQSPLKLTLPPGANGLVLHCCCAPCAGAVLECLKMNNISPVVYFYNPNIHPQKEYEIRRDELIEMCGLFGFEYAVGDYAVRQWMAAVKGHEDEPERSTRCQLCFDCRLLGTALFAKERGINLFSSTMATSRWKSKQQVDAAGKRAMEQTAVTYWEQDWRKKGMAQRRNYLVREIGFYNQLYCGCVFGRLNEEKTKALHSRKNKAAAADSCQACDSGDGHEMQGSKQI